MQSSIDAQAQAHFDRVIADGGLVPSGLSGVNAFFTTVKTIYATSDITTAISVGLDAQVLGYKLGAGAGTTAGQAAQKLYSCSGASGDVVQTTAASQPLLLVHEGANYWWGSGVSGNFIQTVQTYSFDSFVNQTTLSFQDTGYSNIFNYGTQGANSAFSLNYSKSLNRFSIVLYAPSFTELNFNYTLNTNQQYSIRTTRNSTNGSIVIELLIGSTWTSIYSTTSSTGALSNKGRWLMGAFSTAFWTLGKVYRSITYDLSNNILLDFNPNQYNAANSQTQWTSSTGEVWSINTGTATTGYKGQLVDRTIVQGDRIGDSMTSGTLASRQYFTSYSAHRFLTYNGDGPLYSGGSTSHILYTGLSTQVAFNGANLNSGNSSPLTNLATIDFNSTTSKIRINAGADVSGNSGTQTSTDLKIFVYLGTQFGNANLNTLIQTRSINTDAQKTAMYNYIRSINGNSF